jgi:mRNA-degrading endonuclease RelE of RelBE toxin-antitoxin system
MWVVLSNIALLTFALKIDRLSKMTKHIAVHNKQKVTKITRRLAKKTPKKWVEIVSEILNNLYGGDVCYRQAYRKIIIYVPKTRVHKYMYSIIEKIESEIEQSKNTSNEFRIEDDVSVVFEDGVSQPCEWRIEQILKLKSACSITYENDAAAS